MPIVKVYIPDDLDGRDPRRMSAREWLNEFICSPRAERTRVFDLPGGVRLGWVAPDERTKKREIHRTSLELFRAFKNHAAAEDVLVRCSWPGARLGPQGLWQLNWALRTTAKRAGGLNIVRDFLATRPGGSQPLRCDWPALLAYLEIRPIFTLKPTPAPSTPTTPVPHSLATTV